jgi:uncharacterized phage protein gp47/JayE
MSFKIPTLESFARRARNAFNGELKGTDAWLFPNNVYVTAKVFAALVWQAFGRLRVIDRERFVHTAQFLESIQRHAKDFGMSLKEATFAQGNVYIVADNVSSIPAGTRFTRSDGVTFDSQSIITTLPGSDSRVLVVPVTCNVVGKIGNTVAGSPLKCSLSLTLNSVDMIPTVDEAGIGQGTESEDKESLRERVLVRKRTPPMGGSETDYWQWARSIPGVTRVFVESRAFGPGTVGVWFLMDDTYENGIPQQADVDAVQAYLDNVKPVTANVFVRAPVPDCIEVVVKGITPDTQEVRVAAALELQSVFRHMTGVSLTKAPVSIHVSWLWSAVSNATGERFHTIEAPLTDLTFTRGVIPCLQRVRFIQ